MCCKNSFLHGFCPISQAHLFALNGRPSAILVCIVTVIGSLTSGEALELGGQHGRRELGPELVISGSF
jgi:hypothetical protein